MRPNGSFFPVLLFLLTAVLPAAFLPAQVLVHRSPSKVEMPPAATTPKKSESGTSSGRVVLAPLPMICMVPPTTTSMALSAGPSISGRVDGRSSSLKRASSTPSTTSGLAARQPQLTDRSIHRSLRGILQRPRAVPTRKASLPGAVLLARLPARQTTPASSSSRVT